MKRGLVSAAVVLAISSAISIGCGSDDDSSTSKGGGGGVSGKAGSNGTAGTGTGTGGNGMTTGGYSTGGNGTGGNSTGGNSTGGGQEMMGGMGGEIMMNGGAGEAGAGGASGNIYTQEMVTRGTEIVRGAALCGGCHTATNGGMELGGNPLFKNSTLPAPNLTNDATGLGHWTDAQIMNAFRNGVDDEGRHLDSAMPYWLFHNMSDADALAVVAFLRSLPKVSASVGDANPDATPVTPLAPSAFPSSTLLAGDVNYAAAQTGKYLVSGVARCVTCHSPSTAGLPSVAFFSGVPPANNTTIFSPNITPDGTGISGWTADDVATALKVGTNKASVTLCGSMPSAAKGYGNLTDADAHAIGVYLTTIPAVSKPTAAPTLEPACP